MKNWLRNSNGWQRIWFVATTLSLFYGIFCFPIQMMSPDPHYHAVMQEMNNPNCHRFMTAPFDSLVEPRFNESCWNIWLDRSYADGKVLSYTKDRLVEEHSKKVIMELGFLAGIGSILALIFSGFILALGATTNWIIVGFSRNKSNQ